MKAEYFSPIRLGMVFFLFHWFLASGQFNNLGIDGEWYEGKFVLNDDTELRGLVQYNDKLGLYKFRPSQKTQENEIKTFQERSIKILEYFDPAINDYRKYFSLNCKSEESGFKGDLLFEVLHEFKDRAIVRRKTRVVLVGKDSEGLEAFSRTKGQVTAQKEGLFCIGENGELKLFFVTTWAEYDGVLIDKSRNKSRVDKSVLKENLAEYWEALNSYAKSNGLSFSDRDDILKILEFSKSLEKD